jgi:hypothetical protein
MIGSRRSRERRKRVMTLPRLGASFPPSRFFRRTRPNFSFREIKSGLKSGCGASAEHRVSEIARARSMSPVGRVFTGGATITRGVARCQRRRLRPRHSRLEISLALKTLAPRPPARPRTASCRRTPKVDRRIPETIPRRCRGCSPCA